MSNEKFFLKFIIEFNKIDKEKTCSSKVYWKSKGFLGEFLYYLRNILVHETIDCKTFNNINEEISFTKVLEMFKNIGGTLSSSDKMKCIKYISDNYEDYFKELEYKRVDSNCYHFYVKTTNIQGLNKNIFLYNSNNEGTGFISIGIHTYNYETDLKNNVVVEGKEIPIYVRSEQSGFVLLNYYGFDEDYPISLEWNRNDEFYKLSIPRTSEYDHIRENLSIDEAIDITLSKSEFNQKLNILYGDVNVEVRKLIKEIESGFEDIKNDIANINL